MPVAAPELSQRRDGAVRVRGASAAARCGGSVCWSVERTREGRTREDVRKRGDEQGNSRNFKIIGDLCFLEQHVLGISYLPISTLEET